MAYHRVVQALVDTLDRGYQLTLHHATSAAGLAVGVWQNLESRRRNWQADRLWEPRGRTDQRDAPYAEWLKAVERSLDWIDLRAAAGEPA